MKQWFYSGMLILCILASASAASATEVKMTGDARIHPTYFAKQNFTGWDASATRTSDVFAIWERFRLRTDFIANEGLKFRLGVRVTNKVWGNNTFTVDNPVPVIDVYQAYLQFFWPGTAVEFSIGQQDLDLPLSAPMLCSNPVLGGSRGPGAFVTVPLLDDSLKAVAGFMRPVDSNRDFDPTTRQVPDEIDAYFLALPITLEGFAATPWGMLGVVGRNADFSTAFGGAGANQTAGSNLVSAGSGLPGGVAGVGANWADPQNAYFWVGTTLAVTALDPFKFYGDIVYGRGASSDRARNRRAGLFADAAMEYTGLSWVTPQLTFWYATGEDGSTRNGSERLPVLVGAWGPGNSFLWDCSQAYNRGFMGVNYLGGWGFVATLENMTFVPDLSHRLTFTFEQGTNSAQAIRAGNLAWGYGNYFQMGRDLAASETVLAVNLDTQYDIYKNLALILETGWAHGNFDRSVWGSRLVNQAASGDAWKLSLGVQYKF